MKPLFYLTRLLSAQILYYISSITTASIILPLAAGLLLSDFAAAREKPVVEIGTSMGVTVSGRSGMTITHIGIPGAGISDQSMIYASLFPGNNVIFEPQLGLSMYKENSRTYTSLGLGVEIAALPKGTDAQSPFLALTLRYLSASGSEFSESSFSFGGKIGYRFPVGKSMGLRIESGYSSSWILSEMGVFSFGIAFGAVARRQQ
jgi:hypothetical protein